MSPLNEKQINDEHLYLARVLKFVLLDLLAVVHDGEAFDEAVNGLMSPFRSLDSAVLE